MIKFSSQGIDYDPEEKSKDLVVDNHGQQTICFKIKTNQIKAIDAKPNVGYIPPNGNAKITVKKNIDILQNVKLQFTYAQVKQVPKGDPKQFWKQLQAISISKTFVVNQKQKNGKSINDNFKSYISEHVEERKESQDIETDKAKRKEQKIGHEVEEKQNLQAKIKAEKQINKQLEQNIKKAEKAHGNALSTLKKEEKPLQVECRKNHIDTKWILIGSLLMFALGFFFGRSSGELSEN